MQSILKRIIICSLSFYLSAPYTVYAESRVAGVIDAGIEDGNFNGQTDIFYSDGKQSTGNFSGTNLNADNRRIYMDYGQQGKYKLTLEYDQIPRDGNDNAQTIFQGIGQNSLTLPSGWVDANSTSGMNLSSLQSFDLDSERERFKGKIDLISGKEWDLSFTYRRDKKEGVDKIGGAVGDVSGGAPPMLISSLGASILPEPIDQVTHQAELTLNYQKERYQLQANLRASRFNNEFSSLTWENPFIVTNGPGTGDFGQLSLDPDNQFYQATLSGGYQFTPTTRFSGALSTGLMLQDDPFLAYSIESGLGGNLPKNSLDGEVVVTTASMKLTSRPLKPLRLKASYRYQEHDNKTARTVYTPVVIDHHVSSYSFTNQPYSYQKQNLDLSAFYRLSPRFDLGLEYGFDQKKRSQAELEESQEHTIGGILKYTPSGPWSASISLRHGERDGGTYIPYSDPDTTTNPLLRKYHLADRTRDNLSISANYLPSENLTLSGRVDFIQDDYSNTQIGLTESDEFSTGLDLSWSPRRNATVYGFLNHGDISSNQAGSDSGGGPPSSAPNWFVDTDDQFSSVGFGVKISRILPNLDIGADYTYSTSAGDIKVTDNGSGGSGGISYYPDLTTKLHSLQLYGRYRWNKDLYVRMSYLHEKYASNDWALDGINATSVSNVLFLGEDSLNYTDNILALSLVYYFR
jgi:MtrB/PioB family decaheme-associated outer membrane protein